MNRLRQKIEAALRRTRHSDRRIARELKTSHPTVAKVRRELGLYDPDAPRLGLDGKQRRPPEKLTPDALGEETVNVNRSASELVIALDRLKKIGRASPEHQDAIRRAVAGALARLKARLDDFFPP